MERHDLHLAVTGHPPLTIDALAFLPARQRAAAGRRPTWKRGRLIARNAPALVTGHHLARSDRVDLTEYLSQVDRALPILSLRDTLDLALVAAHEGRHRIGVIGLAAQH